MFFYFECFFFKFYLSTFICNQNQNFCEIKYILQVIMLNANLKSTVVMLITKKYYVTLLGNHISYNFTIHINKHNYYVLYKA